MKTKTIKPISKETIKSIKKIRVKKVGMNK